VPVLGGGDKDTSAADGLEVWVGSACAGSVSSFGSMGEQRQSGIGDRMIFSQHSSSSKSSRCFSGTTVLASWHISTHTGINRRKIQNVFYTLHHSSKSSRRSLALLVQTYFLYWYKSTNTDT
jgi:Na+-translocating ferredoxin:NAD+ oxidoreductase RnfD subunit